MVKSMFNKTVTEEIVHYQALGFSAEETRVALKDKNEIEISLNTIYKHRRSPIGQEIAARCKNKGYKWIDVWESYPTTELIDVTG
jgi:hypothetical protein